MSSAKHLKNRKQSLQMHTIKQPLIQVIQTGTFFPSGPKKRIDLVQLMRAHGNQTYCQNTTLCTGENHITWKNQQYSFFKHIHL